MKTIKFKVAEVRELTNSKDNTQFAQVVLEKESVVEHNGCKSVKLLRAYFSCAETNLKEGDDFVWDDKHYTPISKKEIEREGKMININTFDVAV